MELIERPKRKKDRNKSRLALSLIRARPATCANETAEKWPENGPTDSPVVNPDCKRAFIIRRPGEGEGEGKCTMENLGDASFLPLFSIEVTMSRRKFTSNYCYGGSPEFLPSLRFFFFFFCHNSGATSNRKERLRLEFYCFVFLHLFDGFFLTIISVGLLVNINFCQL